MNNATIVEIKGASQTTCFINTQSEVYCFGRRVRAGTADSFPSGDYSISDTPAEMANLKKVEFNFNAFNGSSSVNAALSIFVVAFVSVVVGIVSI